ncbi:hypothetical protein IV102_22710 [bacterium]|nr:hypothetical protein [bacterium]
MVRDWSLTTSGLLLVGACLIGTPGCGKKESATPSPSPAVAASASPSASASASASPVASTTGVPGESPTLTPEEEKTRLKLKGLVKEGMNQILLGHHQESLPFLQEAYQVDPTDAETHYWLFKAYEKLEPNPAGTDAPGPHAAEQVIYYTDMVSWRTEAEAYLETIPTATKFGIASVEIILEEGAKEPAPPPPPPPGSPAATPKIELPKQP